MAYAHTRAGICYSGACVSGLSNKNLNIKIGSTEQSPFWHVPFSIQAQLDGGPSTCTFVVGGAKPTLYQDVLVYYGTATRDLYWAGSLLNVNATLAGDVADTELIDWAVQAVDRSWLLDYHTVLHETYRDLSVNTIARRILAQTSGGFVLGYCPSSLGSLAEFTIANKRPLQALTELAKAANAFIRIRPGSYAVDICQTFPDGNALTLTDTTPIRLRGHESSGSMLANHVTVIGRGSQTTDAIVPGGTTIPVEQADAFEAAGGFALIANNLITYTGLSAATGPGSLTGVSGITTQCEVGTSIRVRGFAEDATSQTTLAAALGSGRSGVAKMSLTDDRLSGPQAQAMAASYLAFYKDAIQAVSYDIDMVYGDSDGLHVGQSHIRVGKLVAASMTDPFAITGDLRVQSVGVTYEADIKVSQLLPRLQQSVQLRTGRRADVLDVVVVRS